MQIVSLCPLRAGFVLWEASPEKRRLTVIVKGTFSLAHGSVAALAPAQIPLSADRYFYEHVLASLYVPSDRVPFKPRVDVMVVGRARPPGGSPRTALTARMSVGPLSKALWITGEQRWTKGATGLVPSAPVPFVDMPIQYERAALDAENPVGVRAGAGGLGALAAPCIQATAGATVAGFGPISPRWPARTAHGPSVAWAGSMSETGVARGPAPQGFDGRVFNAAPRDQQLPEIAPGAKIVLEAMHPTLPRFESFLPFFSPQSFLVPASGGAPSEIPLRCDTVWIDAERASLALTWRGALDLAAIPADTNIAVVAEPAGVRMRGEDVLRVLRTTRAVQSETVPLDAFGKEKPSLIPPKRAQTLPTSMLSGVVLPFAEKTQEPPSTSKKPPRPDTTDLFRRASDDDEVTLARAVAVDGQKNEKAAEKPADSDDDMEAGISTLALEGDEAQALRSGALPFVTAILDEKSTARPGLPSLPSLPEPRDVGGETLAAEEPPKKPTLPFAPRIPDAPPPRPLPENSPVFQTIQDEPTTETERGSRPALPFPDAPKKLESPPRESLPSVLPFVPPSASAPIPPAPAPPAFVPILPPAPARPAYMPIQPEPYLKPAEPALSANQEQKHSKPEEIGLSLEAYARVKAALWEEGAARDEVLKRYGTTEAAFREAERRWAEVIADDAKQGRAERALAVHAALAAAVESERQTEPSEPSLDDYAKIRVALEDADEMETVLAGRGMTVSAWKKVDTAIRRRAKLDADLQKTLRKKLMEARASARAGLRSSDPTATIT